MSSVEQHCITCGVGEESARFERCVACGRIFCPDCAYRAAGRRYCSAQCARNFFYGEDPDDDENDAVPD
ncbi:MAG TPA: hypothetical protein VG323_13400 [Thermoanaerobaculia bacterium]|nr:hypothetical protein [Thermoanaerobaculia bacterium]